jgi:uncharacterized membrane protein
VRRRLRRELRCPPGLYRGVVGDLHTGREIWLKFATWILLALEFAFAADLLRTAVAPTWEDIAKLAVIATIRTMLNYFLAKDIAAFDAARQSGGNPPPATISP